MNLKAFLYFIYVGLSELLQTIPDSVVVRAEIARVEIVYPVSREVCGPSGDHFAMAEPSETPSRRGCSEFVVKQHEGSSAATNS